MIVISPLVGHKAGRAILYTVFRIGEITAAFVPQGVQRTVAEKAVKIRGVFALMARKILAFFILEKFIVLHFLLLKFCPRIFSGWLSSKYQLFAAIRMVKSQHP